MLVPLLFLAATTAKFVCIPVTLHDGDNVRCGAITMRLAGIDAPELAGSPKCRRPSSSAWCDDAAGLRSRDHLRALVKGKQVICEQVAPNDRYGRPIVRCWAGSLDLGAEQLKGGFAKRWP